MKQFVACLLIVCTLSSCGHKYTQNASIVMLKSSLGAQCTGFQVKAPSRQEYLVTAGHCADLADAVNSIWVIMDNGAVIKRRVIAVDLKADITLMEPVPGLPALEVAGASYPGESLIILGHGYGLPTWEVDCHLIGDMDVMDWRETMCSSQAVPGHSGSPVLDPAGHVVGVLSVAGAGLSGFTRLSDLQDFLKGY
jgi:hypothetical protein